MSRAGTADCLTVDIEAKVWPGGRQVLGPIGFSVAKGQVVGLTGPSGCGKSTLLSILAGLDTGYEGRVTWAGAPRLGIVFQSPRLLPWRTVLRNVALAGAGRRTADEDAIAILARLGLAEAAQSYPWRLSLGMARRVALARALIVDPDVLLLDEAFVSLDEVSADLVRSVVLDRVSRAGMTVLMISHDMREIGMMADRLLVLGGSPARLEADRMLGSDHAAGPVRRTRPASR